MRSSSILLVLLLSFIAGISWRSFFDVGLYWLIFVLFSGIIFISFYKNKTAMLVSVVVLFLGLGTFVTDSRLEKLSHLDRAGEEFSGYVEIVQEPVAKEKYQRITIQEENNKGGRILVYADQYPKLHYGQQLHLDCELKIPENFADDFDWQMYLAKDHVYYQCQKPEIFVLGDGKNKPLNLIAGVAQKLEENVNQVLPQPEAALAAGLLLGGSNRLSEEVSNDFSRTGMTHIVAVSGYNVTIIAHYLMLIGILIGLWRKQAFYFALAGIFFFVAMIGFPPSGVRAAIMGIILLWAMKNGRLSSSINAVVLSGAIMLFLNPMLLRWDIGFQLSFLATLGIILIYPFFNNYFVKKNKAFGIAETLFLTISAQIFVIPIIVQNFHQLSVLSLLANIIILPLIPITMLLVFASGIAGFIFYPLSLVLAWVSYPFLKFEIGLVHLFSDISWSSIEIKELSSWYYLGWYGLLAGLLVIYKKKFDKPLAEKLAENKNEK